MRVGRFNLYDTTILRETYSNKLRRNAKDMLKACLSIFLQYCCRELEKESSRACGVDRSVKKVREVHECLKRTWYYNRRSKKTTARDIDNVLEVCNQRICIGFYSFPIIICMRISLTKQNHIPKGSTQYHTELVGLWRKK